MTLELSAGFLLGLLGGVHCLGMCGPIAIALAGGPPTGRGAFVLGRVIYNSGRVLAYAALGVLFGLFGQALRLAGLQQALSILAGVAMLILALLHAGLPGLHLRAGGLLAWTGGMQRLWGRLFARRTPGALLGLGLLNGLLPCGLVYAGLAGAAATGSAGGGALFMTAFGLGTFPVMLAVSLAGQAVRPAFNRFARPLVPGVLGLLAGLLILRGLGLGIPYLSPAFPAGGKPACCCHGTN